MDHSLGDGAKSSPLLMPCIQTVACAMRERLAQVNPHASVKRLSNRLDPRTEDVDVPVQAFAHPIHQRLTVCGVA